MKIEGIDGDIKGAIFDMDGLLVDSEKLYWDANIQAAKEENIPVPHDAYLNLVGATVADMENFYHKYFKTVEARNKFIKRTDDIVWEWINEGRLTLRPGVKEALDYFEQHNIKMAIASSNYKKVIELVIEKLKIQKYFEFYLSYADVVAGKIKAKPAPDIYLLAAKKINLPKNELMVFEDSSTGVEAAKNAGIDVVMVPDLKQPTSKDRKNATLIVKDFFEFLNKVITQ